MDENDKKSPSCPAADELRAGPDLGDGSRPFVRHTADHKISIGVMTPVEEGQMLHEGAFHLDPVEGTTDRFKVQALPAGTLAGAAPNSKGPSKANSKAYVNNWDGIFGKKTTVGEA